MAIEVTIKPEYEVKKENGVAIITPKNENAFVEAAKEAGIEKKTLDEVSKFKEGYLAAAIKEAVDESQAVMEADKDITSTEVETPYGLNKSTNVKTYVTREKEMRIPGDGNKTIKKSTIKNVISSKEYVFPKTQRKALEQQLTDALLDV